MAGDLAVITAGTVTAVYYTFADLEVQVGAGSGAGTLQLFSSVIGSGGTIRMDAGGTGAVELANSTIASGGTIEDEGAGTTVTVVGISANQGTFNFSASPLNTQSLIIAAGATLMNTGTMNINSSLSVFAGDSTSALVNNGTISITDTGAGAGGQSVIMSPALTGAGTVLLNNAARFDERGAVAAGQTITFVQGATNVIFQDDSPGSLAGQITGFVSGNTITLGGLTPTSLTYTPTSATTGVLTLFDSSGTAVVGLHMSGVYTASDFQKNFFDFGGGQTSTRISTTATTPLVSYTDVATNTSAQAPLTLYSGPVNYLQWQYIWPSSDAAAMSVSTPNAFLKSGAGQDAIQVSSGQNVLDGGGGSNFLIGGTGAGSADTFFVDGRGSVVTWSTIVNFHLGDTATIFGFTGGVSTMPVTGYDGTPGYQGVTIHSELQGTGTGVNASITFAGLDQATLQNHFTFTTGTVGTGASAANYLAILYDH